MNLEQASLENLRVLPREKQQEVFLFCWRNSAKEEDIVQARKELWGNFPREDV